MRRSCLAAQVLLLSLAGAGSAMAADAACQPVLDALAKLKTTPYRMAMTESGAASGLNGGAPRQSEMISTGDKLYLRKGDTWRSLPRPDLDQAEQDAASEDMSCSRLADDGGSAVYAVRSQTEDSQSSGQVWIAQATGLVQRQEIDQDVGGEMGKSHLSVSIDYRDVKPPPGA